jgi:hypothetical protein
LKLGEIPPEERASWSFHKLLRWHLDNGTRPAGRPGNPGRQWSTKQFANALGNVGERTVHNYKIGATIPADIESIERELFENKVDYSDWRQEIRSVWSLAKQQRDAGKHTPIAEEIHKSAVRQRSRAIDPQPIIPSPRNRVPHCAELALSTTQGSSNARFDVLAELFFGRQTIRVDKLVAEYGVSEALLYLATKGCIPEEGSRLGDLAKRAGIRPESGKWRITGPHDEKGALTGSPLGHEVLCRMKQTIEGSITGVSLTVHVLRDNINVTLLEENPRDSFNKDAILRIFLKKCIARGDGTVELSRAILQWGKGDGVK